jgi:ankyrin repeat protein
LKSIAKYTFLLGFILVFDMLLPLKAQNIEVTDSAIYHYIYNNNKKKLLILHNNNKLNEVMPQYQTTPLIKAIQLNKSKSVKYLLFLGADPNIIINKKTPLNYAIETANPQIIKHLLKTGALVNVKDSTGTTLLMQAAQYMPLRTIKQFIKHGASLNATNKNGLKAIHFAQAANNQAVENYLYQLFERRLPDYSDGPYVSYKRDSKIEIRFLKYDSLSKKYSDIRQIHTLQKNEELSIGTNCYSVPHTFSRPPTTYNGVKKMYVFGDIHGQCDSLKKFLVSNKITDSLYNWKFGDGHLVFLGDIFDRGSQVTEVLWLLYKLDAQAAVTGGRIHVLLGNHELMIMEGNYQYINEKYHYLFKNFYLEYKKLFTTKTLLGNWLRSKNAIEIINNKLFVHAGLHPEISKLRISVDSMNKLIYYYLNAKQKKQTIPETSFLLGNNGLFWYRGYLPNNESTTFPDTVITDQLRQFGIETIIVGHTIVPQITELYNGKLFILDVPYYQLPENQFEALYIDNIGYYRIMTNRNKLMLKTLH